MNAMPSILLLLVIPALLSGMITSEGNVSVEPYRLEWRNITAVINKKIIVHSVSGYATSGRILGVIGPSGCGKSTLLRSLGLHSPCHGTIILLNSSSQRSVCEDDVAMMHQEDSFFSMLTVRETLDFYLNLQKYCSASTVASATSINEFLGTLNLLGVQNSMVGSRVDSSDGKSQRGISGGELKRLALACALLHRPRVLIADEPTSGLDSHHALQVVQQLRNLAQQRGIAVICSLHQPPSSIWALLDDVLVMAPRGRVAYFGPRADVLRYLEGLGLGCPPHTNPAEHLLEVGSPYTSGGESVRKASEERIQHIVNAFLDHQGDFRARCSGGTADAVSVGPIRPLRSQRLPVLASIKRSWCRFVLLLQRSVRQVYRDHWTNLVRAGASVVLALIVGCVYAPPPAAVPMRDSISARVNVIAQAVINVCMLSLLKTLQLLKREQGVVGREMHDRLFRPLEYLLAKALAELPVDAAVAAGFGAVVHARGGLQCSRGECIQLLALLGSVSSSLGLAVSALAPTTDTALTVGPALMVVYLILGAIGPAGANSARKLPPMLQLVRKCSPMKWGCEGLCAAEFAGDEKTFRHTGAMVSIRRFATRIKNVLQILRHRRRRGDDPDSGKRSGGEETAPPNSILGTLGIPHASRQKSVTVLWATLWAHLALAFLGLHIPRSQG